MTTYQLSDVSSLAAAFQDSDTPSADLAFKKINGVDIDWAANGGVLVLPLDIGSITIYQKPLSDPPNTYPVYDNGGTTVGQPGVGQQKEAGVFTYTMTDGVNETSPEPIDVPLNGLSTTPPAPRVTNTAPPSISGNTTLGSALTYTPGTWSGTGTVTVTWVWRDASGTLQSGGSTYTTADPGDSAKTIWVQENASDDNSPPITEAVSNSITMETATGTAALVNTAKPTFTGTPQVGQTLSGSPGTWTGEGTVTVTGYQWYRNGAAISGATSINYTLVSADAGTSVFLRESVQDSAAQTGSADSLATSVASTGTKTWATVAAAIEDEFASHPDKGWQGFTITAGFNIQTAASATDAKAAFDAWRTGTPTSVKTLVECDWDGLSSTGTAWSGVQAAKLTSGSDFGGYQMPSGGFWIRPKAGRTPVFGSRIEFIGIPRLHWEVPISPVLGGSESQNTTCAFRARTTSFYPLNGCIALTNMRMGTMDDRPGTAVSSMTRGVLIDNAYSGYIGNVRAAGCRQPFGLNSLYHHLYMTDAQQTFGDRANHFGFPAGLFSGRMAYGIDEYFLERDMIQSTASAGLHGDLRQNGTTSDGHAGYRTLVRYGMAHRNSSVATDAGTQGNFRRTYNAWAGTMGGAERDVLIAFNAYNGTVNQDPAGTGDWFVEHITFLRSGLTDVNVTDSDQWVVVSGKPPGSASTVSIQRNVFSRFINLSSSTITPANNTYVDCRKNVTSGTGLTEAQALRPEDYFGTAFNAGVSRSGADLMTYTIPGEDSTDFATAWYALRDFFEPAGGYATYASGNGITDPELWPDAPVRP